MEEGCKRYETGPAVDALTLRSEEIESEVEYRVKGAEETGVNPVIVGAF